MSPQYFIGRTALLVLALSYASAATKVGPGASIADVRRQLMAIELDVVRANETCDRPAIDQIEADEFIFTNPAGKVIDKKQDLDSMKECRPSQVNASIEDDRIQLYGSVAILNAVIIEHPTDKQGSIVTRRYRFTDVFVWREKRWQMVLGHATRIPEVKPN
jgi:hypothetical protein